MSGHAAISRIFTKVITTKIAPIKLASFNIAIRLLWPARLPASISNMSVKFVAFWRDGFPASRLQQIWPMKFSFDTWQQNQRHRSRIPGLFCSGLLATLRSTTLVAIRSSRGNGLISPNVAIWLRNILRRSVLLLLARSLIVCARRLKSCRPSAGKSSFGTSLMAFPSRGWHRNTRSHLTPSKNILFAP